MKVVCFLLAFSFSSLLVYSQTSWVGNYTLQYQDSTSLNKSDVVIWLDGGGAVTDNGKNDNYRLSFKAYFKSKMIWEFTGNVVLNGDTVSLFVDKYYHPNKKIESKVNKKVDKKKPFYIIFPDKGSADYIIKVMQGPKKNKQGKLNKETTVQVSDTTMMNKEKKLITKYL